MKLFEKYQMKQDEKDLRETVEMAEERFQVREYGSELWLTHNGNLICPCSMLKDDPVDALRKMRELYVERDSKGKRFFGVKIK